MMEEKELEQQDSTEENQKEETLEELLNRINNRDTGAMEHKDFTIISDINKEDYRYFFYHSALLKNKWVLALYLLLPPGLAFVFAFQETGFSLGVFLFMTCILYIFMAGLQVIKTESKLAKIKKESPMTLHTTRTRFTFAWNYIVHTKNEETIKVKYSTLKQVCNTSKRTILYFHSNKAMIIHNKDIEDVIPLKEFTAFLNSKIKK